MMSPVLIQGKISHPNRYKTKRPEIDVTCTCHSEYTEYLLDHCQLASVLDIRLHHSSMRVCIHLFMLGVCVTVWSDMWDTRCSKKIQVQLYRNSKRHLFQDLIVNTQHNSLKQSLWSKCKQTTSLLKHKLTLFYCPWNDRKVYKHNHSTATMKKVSMEMCRTVSLWAENLSII